MNSSCNNCINQNSSYCESHNKTKYGYCGNWERIVNDDCIGCEENEADEIHKMIDGRI